VYESSQHRYGNSVYRPSDSKDDPCYFARKRTCSKCGEKWQSAELPLDYILKLRGICEALKGELQAARVERETQNRKLEGIVFAQAARLKMMAKLTRDNPDLCKALEWVMKLGTEHATVLLDDEDEIEKGPVSGAQGAAC